MQVGRIIYLHMYGAFQVCAQEEGQNTYVWMKRRAQKEHNTLFGNAALRHEAACNRVQTVTSVVGHTASVLEGQMIVVIYSYNRIF